MHHLKHRLEILNILIPIWYSSIDQNVIDFIKTAVLLNSTGDVHLEKAHDPLHFLRHPSRHKTQHAYFIAEEAHCPCRVEMLLLVNHFDCVRAVPGVM